MSSSSTGAASIMRASGRIDIQSLLNPPSPIPKDPSSESVDASNTDERVQTALSVLTQLAGTQPAASSCNFSANPTPPAHPVMERIARLQNMMCVPIPMIYFRPSASQISRFRYVDGTELTIFPDNNRMYVFTDQSTYIVADNVIVGPIIPSVVSEQSPPCLHHLPAPQSSPAPQRPTVARGSPTSQHPPVARSNSGSQQPSVVLTDHRTIKLGRSTQAGEQWREKANQKGLMGVFDFDRSDPS